MSGTVAAWTSTAARRSITGPRWWCPPPRGPPLPASDGPRGRGAHLREPRPRASRVARLALRDAGGAGDPAWRHVVVVPSSAREPGYREVAVRPRRAPGTDQDGRRGLGTAK